MQHVCTAAHAMHTMTANCHAATRVTNCARCGIHSHITQSCSTHILLNGTPWLVPRSRRAAARIRSSLPPSTLNPTVRSAACVPSSSAVSIIGAPHEQHKNTREDDLEIDEEVYCVLDMVVFAHVVLRAKVRRGLGGRM